MPSSTRWRVYVESNWGGSVVGISEVEMMTSIGGADQCTGGTASASSVYSGAYAASMAFDDNTTTFWDANVGPPGWIEYTFASAKDIVEFSVRACPASNLSDTPQNFYLQYWDGSQWVSTLWRAAEGGWSAEEKRTYSTSSPSASKQFWRMLISDVESYPYAGISEMEMRTSYGGVDQCTGGAPSSSSNFNSSYTSTNAFDDNNGTRWSERNGTSGWIGYVFASAKDIVEFSVTANGVTTAGDAPKDFAFQYWDGSAWVTYLEYIGVIWNLNETKIFPARQSHLYLAT